MGNKFISILSICIVTLFALPVHTLAAGAGSEEVLHAEPSGLLYTTLVILSFVTIIYMIFLEIRDNG